MQEGLHRLLLVQPQHTSVKPLLSGLSKPADLLHPALGFPTTHLYNVALNKMLYNNAATGHQTVGFLLNEARKSVFESKWWKLQRERKTRNFYMLLILVFSRTPFFAARDTLRACVHTTVSLYSLLIFQLFQTVERGKDAKNAALIRCWRDTIQRSKLNGKSSWGHRMNGSAPKCWMTPLQKR